MLLGTLAAQLLLLSFQITRNHDVRLIRVWAVAILDPFERNLGKLVGETTEAWRTYQVPMFHAEKFKPEEWAELFRKAGAKFAGKGPS